MVIRVIDGDSIEARLTKDIGFHGAVSFIQRLRLNRINSKPIKTLEGQDASRFLTELLKPNMSLVDMVTIKPYKYGDEWMVEITLKDGRNVSDEMVQNAMAVYWDGVGTRPD